MRSYKTSSEKLRSRFVGRLLKAATCLDVARQLVDLSERDEDAEDGSKKGDAPLETHDDAEDTYMLKQTDTDGAPNVKTEKETTTPAGTHDQKDKHFENLYGLFALKEDINPVFWSRVLKFSLSSDLRKPNFEFRQEKELLPGVDGEDFAFVLHDGPMDELRKIKAKLLTQEVAYMFLFVAGVDNLEDVEKLFRRENPQASFSPDRLHLDFALQRLKDAEIGNSDKNRFVKTTAETERDVYLMPIGVNMLSTWYQESICVQNIWMQMREIASEALETVLPASVADRMFISSFFDSDFRRIFRTFLNECCLCGRANVICDDLLSKWKTDVERLNSRIAPTSSSAASGQGTDATYENKALEELIHMRIIVPLLSDIPEMQSSARLLLYKAAAIETATPVVLAGGWQSTVARICKDYHLAVLEINVSELFSCYVGESEKNIRDLFALISSSSSDEDYPAKSELSDVQELNDLRETETEEITPRAKGLVVILQNVDLVAKTTFDNSQLHHKMLTTFLNCLDGIDSGVKTRVFGLVALSEMPPSKLVPSFVRPGRFDFWHPFQT